MSNRVENHQRSPCTVRACSSVAPIGPPGLSGGPVSKERWRREAEAGLEASEQYQLIQIVYRVHVLQGARRGVIDDIEELADPGLECHLDCIGCHVRGAVVETRCVKSLGLSEAKSSEIFQYVPTRHACPLGSVVFNHTSRELPSAFPLGNASC